jgi:hypothetical protein
VRGGQKSNFFVLFPFFSLVFGIFLGITCEKEEEKKKKLCFLVLRKKSYALLKHQLFL